MGIPIIQSHGLILPQYHPLGTEHEDIADLLCHVSSEFYCADTHEKTVQILAIENVAAGVPGNLWCWIELSPVVSTVSYAYWAAIGGGGGINPATMVPWNAIVNPVAPLIEAAAGVDGIPHNIILPWAIHSVYARVVIWTPVAAALPGAFWQVQVIISGKTP